MIVGAPPGSSDWTIGFDPSCEFDATGAVLYCYVAQDNPPPGTTIQHQWRLYIARSVDNGSTWGSYTLVDGGTQGAGPPPFYNDKPYIAVDHTGGQYNGNVYVSWTNAGDQTSENIQFAAYTNSTNGSLQLISNSRQVIYDYGNPPHPPGTFSIQGENIEGITYASYPAVGRSVTAGQNRVYVFIAQPNGSDSKYRMRYSTDGGITFSRRTTDGGTTFTPVAYDVAPYSQWREGMMNNIPSVAVDPTNGYVYIVYATPTATGLHDWHVNFYRSTNDGLDWTKQSQFPIPTIFGGTDPR
jgi:hypothetical protein